MVGFLNFYKEVEMKNDIYELSWNEDSFLTKLKLFFKARKEEGKKIRSCITYTQAEGFSALSSTYYSIVGTSYSKLNKSLQLRWSMFLGLGAWCTTWLPLTAWCYWRILPLSNHVVDLIGYEGMNADQCDVRQSILRKCGEFDEARMCALWGLWKEPIKVHTLCLLLIGLADVSLHDGDFETAKHYVDDALAEAKKVEIEDPRQAARIYRKCADILDQLNFSYKVPGDELREKARELAEITGAKDQLLKM